MFQSFMQEDWELYTKGHFMPFSSVSQKRLNTCHPNLKRLFEEIDRRGFECTIVEGHRDEERQNEMFRSKKSKIEWPKGKHNYFPSKAVDVAPYVGKSLSWDFRHCLYFAGIVIATARELKIPIRWGGNWDMDDEVYTDQDFQDLVHYELVEV